MKDGKKVAPIPAGANPPAEMGPKKNGKLQCMHRVTRRAVASQVDKDASKRKIGTAEIFHITRAACIKIREGRDERTGQGEFRKKIAS